MAMRGGNPQNLRPAATSEEARMKGRLGGIKSGVLRRQRKTLAEGLKALLKQKDEDGVPYGMKVNLAVLQKALAGDMKAFEALRDTIGEKPGTNVEHSGGLSFEVRWLAGDEGGEDD